ncbi:unnamed protein product [Porites lobata]|uniref:Ion transport domain-containing protein n=1 Tax=Porites lobata TaxID=104759 RepID=A0ABN8MYE9_9CNID|nr:unnamed protein product [Porites lobata]
MVPANLMDLISSMTLHRLINDNIGIAWIAIFQVITLEGWSDIMYFVQDSHSFWNWIYFVVLIVMGSFFLVNLCLVVITMQFQETKAREIELMEHSKKETGLHHPSSLMSFVKFLQNLCKCASQDKEPQVHHHHHHFYHHHHFHHHLYNCFVSASPVMLSNVRNVSDLARSSEIPEIKVQEEGEQEVSFPPFSEEYDVYQKCLASTHEQASRRSSRTSTCSHTLSIHAETASVVSFEDIMAETKTTVTLNIPPPTATVGFFAFASSNSSPRMRKNPNIDKAEHSTSTTVSAEINPQYSSVNFGKQDEPKMELKVEKKSSLRRNDKDALKKRRFSQPVHVKLDCTPTPVISTYRPSEIVNEDIDPDDFIETISYDMFESLFNLRQSVSYDVTMNHGIWQKFRGLCRKITVSKQFTFFIMSVILLNMICMGLEHYNQPDSLTVALETTNIIFVKTHLTGGETVQCWSMRPSAYFLSRLLAVNNFDYHHLLLNFSVCEILLSKGNFALSVFRSIRLLRIFKLVRPVRYQLLVVIKTMTSVMTFFGLLFLFAFAILGMNLFGGKFEFKNAEGELVTSRSNFDDFLWAMVSVFQILTQENWNRVMYNGMRSTNKWAALYFTTLMAVGYYVLFNLLVVILVERFTNSGRKKAMAANGPFGGNLFKNPARYLTIFNDIEKNPGPPLIINNNQVSHLNAFTVAHRSSQSLFVSPSTSHLDLHFVRYANLPRCLTYSRNDLLKIRFRGGDLKPSSELLARLKNASLLRYRGKRSGKKRNKCLHSSITVLTGRRCVTPLRPPGPRIQTFIPVSLSVDLETPIGLRDQRSVAFSLLNARSVKNKHLLIKDWVVDNNIDILALTETCLQPDNKDDHIIGDLTPTGYSFYHSPRETRGGAYTRQCKVIKNLLSSSRSNYYSNLVAENQSNMRSLFASCEHKYFDYVVLLFILTSCVVLALEEPNMHPKKRQIIDIAMVVLTGIFSVEMTMKIVAHGLVIGPGSYLKDGWNVLDGSLVLVSWIDVIITYSTASAPEVLGALKVFRALRTLRPLRMIRRAQGLKLVVQTLLYSLKPIGNTVLIAAIFFVMFAILGVQIFKGTFHFCEGNSRVKDKKECLKSSNGHWENHMYNFDNLPQALISLFVFSTRDGWVEIMHNGIDAVGVDQQPVKNYAEWRLAYFIPFLMLGGFLVLNMIVGVVVENFQRCRERLEDEEKQRRRRKMMDKARSKNQQEVDRTYYQSYSKWRRRVHDMCLHMSWDVVIAMVICLKVICMSLEHYQMSQTFVLFVDTSNYLFTGIFVPEVVLKFIAFGFVLYFKDGWNLVDLVIVILSLAGIIIESLSSSNKLLINPTVARSLRVLRIIRVLKLVKLAKGVRSLLDTLFEALPQVANLGLLFLLLFFIYSCLGIQLFGTVECSPSQPCQGLGPHAHFRDFGTAMLTLFRIATGDNWNGILEDTLRSKCSSEAEYDKYCCMSKYTAPLFFVTFVLAAQFVLVNVVIAVLMKHLKESKEKIAANMAAKDLEKKLKLLTLSAKNFIKGKAKKNDLPSISRRRSIVQLGLGGIELAQLKYCEPENTIDKSFMTEFSRADAIFQEYMRLNANLQKAKMKIVRTSSHNTVEVNTPSTETHSVRQRRNSVGGVRELHKISTHLSSFTVYKSGAKL